jgi:protein TonB
VSSGVAAGNVTKKIPPSYPAAAKAARITGTVKIIAVIGKDGKIANASVVSGHPLLRASALAAVQQWEYKPYLLNNEPVEVQTEIDVVFGLN